MCTYLLYEFKDSRLRTHQRLRPYIPIYNDLCILLDLQPAAKDMIDTRLSHSFQGP